MAQCEIHAKMRFADDLELVDNKIDNIEDQGPMQGPRKLWPMLWPVRAVHRRIIYTEEGTQSRHSARVDSRHIARSVDLWSLGERSAFNNLWSSKSPLTLERRATAEFQSSIVRNLTLVREMRCGGSVLASRWLLDCAGYTGGRGRGSRARAHRPPLGRGAGFFSLSTPVDAQ